MKMATIFCSAIRILSSPWLRSKCGTENLTRRISVGCRLSKDEKEKPASEGTPASMEPSANDKEELEKLNDLWKRNRSKEIVSNKEFSNFDDVNVEDIQDSIDKDKRPFLEKLRMDYLGTKESLLSYMGFEFKRQAPEFYTGPRTTDVLIIGGGAIGSAAAYFLKQKTRDGMSVTVVERDHTYSMSSCSLSVGGLHQQFSHPETIEMSLYGAEFIRSAPERLKVEGLPTPNPRFEPYGYLLLASEEGAETLTENSKLQNSLGARNVLLNPRKLRERFPWLKTDGIALGCLGLEKEGWFDPWMLMLGFRTKAMSYGADFLKGEVVGFQSFHPYSPTFIDDSYFKHVKAAVVRYPDGKYATIKFCVCVIAAGAESGIIGKLAGFGTGRGIMSIPVPIERRKRYVYSFTSPGGPVLDAPLMIDPSGVYVRREGLCNKYVCGLSPQPNEEPMPDNLDVDYNYFDEKVRPILTKRVPAFENMKVTHGRAGFYEYNPVDMNGIIGHHPLLGNFVLACGFNSHGIQHAPAVGRAVSELVINTNYNTIDLSRFGFTRFANEQLLVEKNIA